MSDPLRLDTVGSILAGFDARLRQLETYPSNTPSGTAVPVGGTLTLLGQAVNTATAGPLAFYNDGNSDHFEWMSGTTCPQVSFTLAARSTVMVFGQMGGFFGTGGTASYVQVRAAIMSATTAIVGANDINGTEMRSVNSYQTNGSGVANASASMAYTMVAGTYWAGWGYRMDAGAITTFTLEWSSLAVFLLG